MGPKDHLSLPDAVPLIRELAERLDLSGRAGKRELWHMTFSRLARVWQVRYTALRDQNRGAGFGLGEANERAAFDVADEIEASLAGGLSGPTGSPELVRAVEAPSKSATALVSLAREVLEITDGDRAPLRVQVAWVSEHLGFGLEDLEAAEIPSVSTLWFWDWARGNRTAFVHDFQVPLTKSRSYLGDDGGGLADDGAAMGGVLEVMVKALEQARSNRDGGLRDLSLEAEDGGGVAGGFVDRAAVAGGV
jgi:hypothetical protein